MAQSKEQKELNNLIDEYRGLAGKLGKLPTIREVRRFICSGDKLARIAGSLSELKAETLVKYPELEELEISVKVNPKDIEDYRIGLQKKENKDKNKKTLEHGNFVDYFEQLSKNIFSGKVKPVKVKSKNKKTERILNLVISDIHIGSDVNKEETGVADYGKPEESRRLAAITQEVINYKPQYRAETELEVILAGDIIQNSLHDARDGAPLAEQCARAIHLLSQMLSHFSANFKKVRVRCTTGNHGRNTARHHGRAVNQKWDSVEVVIYYALKTALSKQSNVEFFIPKTPYGSYEVFGQKVLYTHGDSVLNPGYPGKSINTKSLEDQLNAINASLNDKDEFKICVVGHIHTCSQTYLRNGCTLLTNGALIEPDEYAVSIGILESQTGQLLFESVPGYAVGDTRFIRVGRKHDNDDSLDKIIQPFNGF